MIIHAPFSDDIVKRLNGYQQFALAHPYTCPICKTNLVATQIGLCCVKPSDDSSKILDDGYVQDWALDPPTEQDLVYMEIEFNAWLEKAKGDAP